MLSKEAPAVIPYSPPGSSQLKGVHALSRYLVKEAIKCQPNPGSALLCGPQPSLCRLPCRQERCVTALGQKAAQEQLCCSLCGLEDRTEGV